MLMPSERPRPQGYKTFFMLNLTEHAIDSALLIFISRIIQHLREESTGSVGRMLDLGLKCH